MKPASQLIEQVVDQSRLPSDIVKELLYEGTQVYDGVMKALKGKWKRASHAAGFGIYYAPVSAAEAKKILQSVNFNDKLPSVGHEKTVAKDINLVNTSGKFEFRYHGDKRLESVSEVSDKELLARFGNKKAKPFTDNNQKKKQQEQAEDDEELTVELDSPEDEAAFEDLLNALDAAQIEYDVEEDEETGEVTLSWPAESDDAIQNALAALWDEGEDDWTPEAGEDLRGSPDPVGDTLPESTRQVSSKQLIEAVVNGQEARLVVKSLSEMKLTLSKEEYDTLSGRLGTIASKIADRAKSAGSNYVVDLSSMDEKLLTRFLRGSEGGPSPSSKTLDVYDGILRKMGKLKESLEEEMEVELWRHKSGGMPREYYVIMRRAGKTQRRAYWTGKGWDEITSGSIKKFDSRKEAQTAMSKLKESLDEQDDDDDVEYRKEFKKAEPKGAAQAQKDLDAGKDVRDELAKLERKMVSTGKGADYGFAFGYKSVVKELRRIQVGVFGSLEQGKNSLTFYPKGPKAGVASSFRGPYRKEQMRQHLRNSRNIPTKDVEQAMKQVK